MNNKPESNRNREVTLEEVLSVRDRRAELQQNLIRTYAVPVISFTMNIAGPVKTSPQIRRAFEYGRKDLEEHLQAEGIVIIAQKIMHEPTGDEALYAVQGRAEKLKKLCVMIEEASPAGRLFDMDVINTDGTKISRLAERSCIVCGRKGRYCASRRVHSIAELQQATQRLIREMFAEEDSYWFSCLCVNALKEEARTTPKPGLVDRNNNGSHTDMDLPLLLKSADCLKDYFRECFIIGNQHKGKPPAELFPLLQKAGIRAERTMFETTGGINTHKGALFHFGLLSGAAGYLYHGLRQYNTEELCCTVSAVCSGALTIHLQSLHAQERMTFGEQLYVSQGIGGARGEAMSGYTSVRQYGLPVFEKIYADTGDRNRAGVQALLSLIAHTEDTNMIRRGDRAIAREAARSVREIIETREMTAAEIRMLDAQFIDQNLTPGGCADLLSITYLLHDLSEENKRGKDE